MANAKEWSLGNIEYGTATGVGKRNKLLTHVAKVLTLVPFGKPKATPVPLNKSCLCNAKKCKPNVATMINTLNYITLDCKTNINGNLVKKGTKVRLEVANGSPDDMRVIGIETK